MPVMAACEPAGAATALAILQAGSRFLHGTKHDRAKQGPAQITAAAQAADQIDQLRATGVSLIYDPATKTLRTDSVNAIPAAVG